MMAVGCHVFFHHPTDRNWNLFDVVIVGISVLENVITLSLPELSADAVTSVSALRVVRVARLVRILRVCRLMRFFRSLRILTAAILNTVKNCMWVSLLLVLILYVFGVLF